MSTATSKVIQSGSNGASPSRGPGPLELMCPFASVPPLEELEDLTDIPDRRVVFRGVDWSFYDQLVESIPEWRKIHVDYDGKDLEIVRYGILHHVRRWLVEENSDDDTAFSRRFRAEIKARAANQTK